MGAWDLDVMRFVAEHRQPWATRLAFDVMDLGDRRALAVVALVAVVVVALLPAWRVAGAVVAALLASSVLASVLKGVIGRDRPPQSLALIHVQGSSMPSTHAAYTAAAAAALLLGVRWTSARNRRYAVLLALAALVLVAACMVYLGVHWTSDILVGWALGALIGAACARLIRPQQPPARRSGDV